MTGRVSVITLITSISISLIFTVIIIWNLNSVFKMHDESNLNELKDFYTLQQKELIKNEVHRLTGRIRALRNATIENSKQMLKERISSIEVFVLKTIRENPKQNIGSILSALTYSFKWDNETGYFFILSEDGTILHNGSNPALAGSHITEMKGASLDMYKFLSRAYTDGEATGYYTYFKPNDKTKTYNKLAYAKYNPELKVLIGTGVYMDEVDKKVQAEILRTLPHERFGYKNYGYFWIVDTDYNSVFHIDPEIRGKNHYNLTDINGKYIFRDVVDIAFTQGAGYSEYQWYLPDKKVPSSKISYLELYPEWNWIIGTGFYYENYYELIRQEEKISNMILKKSIKRNSIIIISLFIVITTVSMLIYRRIRYIEISQENHINDLSQYKTVIDSSSIVSITDTQGVITHANDQFCEITGYPRETLVGNRHNIIAHPDNPKGVYKELWDTIKEGKTWKGMIKNMTAEGGYFFQKSTIIPFKNKAGEIVRFISISHDVTELFENKSKLQKQLNVDPLTGLGSRSNLINIIGSSKKSDLALIDINSFHRINESYGMAAGDNLLNVFSERLAGSRELKSYDLYRLHSDVFAVFSYASNMEEFAENISTAVAEITKKVFLIEDKEILLRTITGLASGSTDILAHADAALQYAKAHNINSKFYDSSKTQESKIYDTDSQVIKMLSEAIEEGRVVPFFQKIEGVNDKAVKYECLMRIIGKEGEIISPAAFLDISKQTRFYPSLTKIIAKKSIDTFAGTDIEFSINVSAEDVLNPETMDFIYEYALEKFIIRKLTLEIVESESMTSSPIATEALYRFKLAGAKIAIDDFGTGYSNFDYLLKIKADYIKIDGSIIKLIDKDERAKDIARSIVSYAKKLKMKTVAEFISEPALANAAFELGIDYLQGYYIGRPEKNVFTGKNDSNTKSASR